MFVIVLYLCVGILVLVFRVTTVTSYMYEENHSFAYLFIFHLHEYNGYIHSENNETGLLGPSLCFDFIQL